MVMENLPLFMAAFDLTASLVMQRAPAAQMKRSRASIARPRQMLPLHCPAMGREQG